MTREVQFENGKYTYVRHCDGSASALRYGEHWRDLTGDKFVGALVDELQSVRDTSRDKFAIAVLSGLFSGEGWPSASDFQHIAKMAYAMADAMIVERAKEQTK